MPLPRWWVPLLVIAGAALAGRHPASAQVRFRYAGPSLGIEHVWGGLAVDGDFGGGCAIEDYDGDGDEDLFLGTQLGTPMAVYRNDGGKFTDVRDGLGLVESDGAKQILFADLDGDGRRDLLLTRWKSQMRVYRNLGDGHFENRTEGAGLDREFTGPYPGYPIGVSAADVDRDGDLDLYVAVWKASSVGPEAANALFRNDGDFHFVDVAPALGVDSSKKSFQSVMADLSGDGWPDIVVAQDKGGGLTYYESNGAGGLFDRTISSGLDGLGSAGKLIDGMGIAVGDYDRDGRLDVYATNIPDGNVLYHNLGNGRFAEVATQAGVLSDLWGWGTDFLDVDDDGWVDLFVANSAVPDDNRLYHSNGDGTFTDVAPDAHVSGSGFAYAMASGDLDGDGYVDMVITHGLNAPTAVYLNAGGDNHWLKLQLQGTESNRDGIGARITVEANGASQVQERRTGTSYIGHDSTTLLFGMGRAESADRIEIRWPSQRVDEFTQVATEHEYLAIEGNDQLVDVDVPVSTPPERLQLVLPHPNPCQDGQPITLAVRIPTALAGRPATVRVYDLRGREIATLFEGTAEVGTLPLSWDGRDAAGKSVARGSYRVVARAAGDRNAASVILLR